MNNEENIKEKTKEKIKEKKVYLSDNKNDSKQREAVDNLKKVIVKEAIKNYTDETPSGLWFDLFMIYLESRTKPNKSKNDFNYRIERIYNNVISMYSDFKEFTEPVLNKSRKATIVDNNNN